MQLMALQSSIHFFISDSNFILSCNFSHMLPDDDIENLFVSTTKNGVQDHKSLLQTYKFLNKILEQKDIKKHVLLLSDRHASRFDFDVPNYLYEQQIFLFISQPNTTGVTQLLDQINHSLHDNYRQHKKEEYLYHQSINCERFINIISKMWPT